MHIGLFLASRYFVVMIMWWEKIEASKHKTYNSLTKSVSFVLFINGYILRNSPETSIFLVTTSQTWRKYWLMYDVDFRNHPEVN